MLRLDAGQLGRIVPFEAKGFVVEGLAVELSPPIRMVLGGSEDNDSLAQALREARGPSDDGGARGSSD